MSIATPNIFAEKIQGNLAINSVSATTYYNLPSSTGNYLPLSGGTVTGDTIFQSGVTANTISQINYIDFKTSPTVPNPTGGTLYYDSGENALSYKPITDQNDVTVNLGQESLTRIYNGLNFQINNGQVLHITGATSGVPTVALANASKLGSAFTESLAQSSGVATHDIPAGQYGFMTNFGIVRDLNTTAFTVGQEVFLSDTVDGGLTNDPNNIAFTSRISTVGYCLESNATTGKILVNITNENPLQSLTQQEVNVLLGNTISTGVYFYTGMTSASTTTVNVSPMRGWIVFNTYEYATNPLVLNVYYSGGTNIPVTNITTSFDTYFLVNSGGTLYQQTTFPTPEERRDNIFLGRVVHPNKTSILNVEQSVDYDVSPMSAIRDLWVPLKLINEGVLPSYYSAGTTSIKTSSGTFWGNGIGWDTNEKNPNAITVPAYSPANFYYTTQTGGSFTSTTNLIDTANYDVGGVITNIPGAGNYSTQRIFMSQSGVIRIQYAQEYHTTLAKAIAAIQSEVYVINSDNSSDCILIGLLTVKDGATDLSNIDDAVFTIVSKFGEILGGSAGIATTTLQQAYNNSVPPEITTDSTLGGLTIKNGAGSDVTSDIFQGVNSSDVITSFIRADGLMSGQSVSALAISATTYYNLPPSSFSGGTVTGPTNFTNGLSANTISATTYFNLPVTADTFVTGFSLSNNTITLSQNRTDQYSGFSISLSAYTGSSITGLYLPISGGTVTGATSFTEGLTGSSLFISGNLTLSSSTENKISLFNSTSENFIEMSSIDGGISFTSTPDTEDFFKVQIASLSGATELKLGFISQDNSVILTTNDITTNRNINIPDDDGTLVISLNNLHADFKGNITIPFDYLPISGGTVTGTTSFTGGLSANTISATTYQNLPTYVSATTLSLGNVLSVTTGGGSLVTTTINAVTGGTYSNGTITLSGTGNVNGTQITGFGTGGSFTGGTVTGATNFTGGLTANTLSATTVTTSGDITASTFISTQSSGQEGGQINLSTSQTNNVLSGGSISIDIFESKFRIFESGSPNRGVYIELSATSAGVGTNLIGGGGEVNTASNIGSGTGLFSQKSGVDLQFKSLTSTGNTVTITSDSNTVNLEAASSPGGGITWNSSNTTQSMTADNGYVTTASTLTTFTLPSTIAFGKTVEIAGNSSGLWQLNQNSGQQIRFGNTATTVTSGVLSATSIGDCIKLICVSANTSFIVTSSVGNIFFS